jgi:hypothetical protein
MKLALFAVITLVTSAMCYFQPRQADLDDIPTRIPEAAPYVVAEAQAFPPPYHEHWEQEDSPAQCKTCHQKLFDEWNGSMMSNAWRDPVWRAAFLALARSTSAYGECDTPEPPDGTRKATQNPFANKVECSSTFDLGTQNYTVSRPGSLLDFFCSRCHMPADYVDNIPLKNVRFDPKNHLESAAGDANFNPTSDNGTGLAFAKLEPQFRNTEAGKSGIICAVCHTYVDTRDTPFHNYARSEEQYTPAPGKRSRSELLSKYQQDVFQVPDKTQRNLGYSVGAGSFRLSPHAIAYPERFGPLAANTPPTPIDVNTSTVFGRNIPYQHMDPAKHEGYYQAMTVRAEMCAACHDVTNPLPIKNSLGKWVGGFPIERTYTEWANSAYADRPGNENFDPHFKRDCQSCHMQQDYGQPGTAETLYLDGSPVPPPVDHVASEGGTPHPFFTHHFVGGNAYIPGLIGKDMDQRGNIFPYPELSTFSFSSAEENSLYSRAFWMHTERRGAYSQQTRLAWDRLRHVLSMNLSGPEVASANAAAPISITVANTGSGHKFPTGFPEGRTAWLALHAYDLATGHELLIHDSIWNRSSMGVGNLTRSDALDPNFPDCNWGVPAGSADPYSVRFRAVASLGDGCPTLDLAYATPLNLVTNRAGLPIDKHGRVINASNSTGLPQFRDVNGNGDNFDDSFLVDTRLQPRGNAGSQVRIDRYSVVIPAGTQGPIAVSAAIYYQSVEAVVALHFLGNLADTNNDFVLEPCVLAGLCDGRTPRTEPAVVEGAPPVPMTVRNWVISINGAPARRMPLRVETYPAPEATDVYQDAVVKVFFSGPVHGVDAGSFTVTNSRGVQLPGEVDQIGDETWAFFPNQVMLKGGERYTARLKRGVCNFSQNCTQKDFIWRFTVSKEFGEGSGDTSIPVGFRVPGQRPPTSLAALRGASAHKKERSYPPMAMR